jgi:polar amino acid transport system permease protein
MWSWSAFFEFLTSKQYLTGAWTSIWLTTVCLVMGLAIAIVLALMRMSRHRGLSWPSAFFTWLFRGVPLLVTLVIIYTGLPQFGIRLSPLAAGILGLTLNEAAYLSEIVRSGILSVPKGQYEAARALGMTPVRVLRVVVAPQAARIIVPPLGNAVNGLFKTTTLVSVVAVNELLRKAQFAIQINYRVLEGLVAAAVYYLVLVSIWQVYQSYIEKRLNRSYVVTT